MEKQHEHLSKVISAISLAGLKVFVGIEVTTRSEYELITYTNIIADECEIWYDVTGWVVLENDALKMRVKIEKTELTITNDGIVIVIDLV